MNGVSYNLDVLSTRGGFNNAVRHINKTLEISGGLGSGNLGDLLYEKRDEDLSGERGGFLLRMLLVDKLGYKSVSSNLESVCSDVPALAKEFAKWKGVDLVAAYHHPDMGLIIANPKMAEELSDFGALRRRELLVIYAGKGSAAADDSCIKAAELAVSLFEGKKSKPSPDLLRGSFTVKALKKPVEKKPAKPPKAAKPGRVARAAKPGKAAPAAAKASAAVAAPAASAEAAPAPKGPVKMTPMYSVRVANELFHNGNVEAWKRIIASYTAKYQGRQVFVYYDGERITDLNTLFQWGKVKHGSVIQFAVVGTEIMDVAKLQRYLAQAASNRFEAFLHGPVNTVLKLFG